MHVYIYSTQGTLSVFVVNLIGAGKSGRLQQSLVSGHALGSATPSHGNVSSESGFEHLGCVLWGIHISIYIYMLIYIYICLYTYICMYKYAHVQTAHLKKAHITARRLQHIKGHNSQDARSMATRQHICTFYVCVHVCT